MKDLYRIFSISLLIALCFLSGGCAPGKTTLDMPLKANNRWEYKGFYISKAGPKEIRIPAPDHVLEIASAHGNVFLLQVLSGGAFLEELRIKKDTGGLSLIAGEREEPLFKNATFKGDAWDMTFRNEQFHCIVGNEVTKKVPAGEFRARKLAISGNKGSKGVVWLDNATGIVAFEYSYQVDGTRTIVTMELSSYKLR